MPGFRRWLVEDGGAEPEQRLAGIAAWHLGEVPRGGGRRSSRACAPVTCCTPRSATSRWTRSGEFHLGQRRAARAPNWLADTSVQGMARAAGLMVKYVYWLAEVERNHERYFREHVVGRRLRWRSRARRLRPPKGKAVD